MKKKVTIALTLISLILLKILFQETKEKEAIIDTNSIIFRLAEIENEDHPSAMASEYFASLVDERSEGRIKIKVYYDQELGTPKEILEQTQFGGVSMARINVLDLAETVPSLQYYFKPQAYSNPAELIELIDENEEFISSSCEIERIFPLVWYYPDTRCFYSDSITINKVSDLQNIKVKTSQSNVINDVMGRLKCTAVDIATADTYSSFSMGYLDAGETTLSEFILSDYYQFMNYVTLSQYISCPDVMVASTIAFTKLEKADRELIIDCAEDAYKYQKELMINFRDDGILKISKEKELFIEDETFISDMKKLLDDKAVKSD